MYLHNYLLGSRLGGIEHALNRLRDYYESEGDLDIDDVIEFLEELLEETALKEEFLYSNSY